MEVSGEKCIIGARARRLGEFVNYDTKVHGFQPEWAVFRDMWTVEGLYSWVKVYNPS